MKLKYFIPAFIALVGAMLSSCSDEDTVTLLDEIKVSRSYVPIDIDGGEATIDISAKDSWSFSPEDIPEWLTVTPMNGGAGETKVTFRAPAAPDGRTAELKINCASRTQRINLTPVDDESMTVYARERYRMPEDKLARAVHVACGNVCRLDSLAVADEGSKRNLSFFQDMMRAAYMTDIPKMEACVENLKEKSAEVIKSMLIYSINMLRESFIYNLSQSNLTYMTDEEEAFVRNFARFVHVGNYVKIYNLLNNGLAEVEQNGNVRIIMMDLMFSLTGFLRLPRP